MYALRIKESKYSKMLEKNRFFMVGITKTMFEDGEADDELKNLGLTKKDINLVWYGEKRERIIQKSLMQLCDSKQDDAFKLILGYKATDKQIERYKDKYERALTNEFTSEVNTTIIKNYEAIRLSIRKFIDLIEYSRSFVDDLIQDGKLDKAEKAIKVGEKFNAETTKSDIIKILNNL